MSVKFTTGPWKREENGSGFMSFIGPNGECIVEGCRCCQSPYGNSIDPSDEDRANALRLIAAAPDLLQSLKDMVDNDECRFDDHGMCRTHYVTTHDGRCAMAVARETIAKAEGDIVKQPAKGDT